MLTRQLPRLSSLQIAIFRTICYADVFDFPLTTEEVWKFLIAKKSYSRAQVDRAIKTISRLDTYAGFVCLRGRRAIIAKRRSNTRFQQIKRVSAQAVVRTIGWLPTISAIFVTGSLAANNAVASDDIDLMVVTRPGWLWTTRALVAVLSIAVGKYRTRSTEQVRNMWCFNMWLDETALRVPRGSQNLYTAHEVTQAHVLLDKRNIAEEFLYQNSWAQHYLPNAFSADVRKAKKPRTQLSPGLIERAFFLLQRWYMSPARTIEQVSVSHAFFHPRNTRAEVLHAYEQRIRKA
jgi:hypothetical protein